MGLSVRLFRDALCRRHGQSVFRHLLQQAQRGLRGPCESLFLFPQGFVVATKVCECGQIHRLVNKDRLDRRCLARAILSLQSPAVGLYLLADGGRNMSVSLFEQLWQIIFHFLTSKILGCWGNKNGCHCSPCPSEWEEGPHSPGRACGGS